jgi:hypothetical protein
LKRPPSRLGDLQHDFAEPQSGGLKLQRELAAVVDDAQEIREC